MMESIEKLRASQYVGQHMTLDEIADEIEREISERYMLLPVDADGVPIHVGDRMLDVDSKPPLIATAVTSKGFYTLLDLGTFYKGDSTRHSNALFVEELLREFGKAYVYMDGECASTSVLISDYADKLRDLLGVSE